MLDEQRISLDISKQPTPQQVRLGQGDANATRLIVDIFDDGVAYSLAGYSVRLEMRLPDSDSYYSTNGTSSGNTATFDIDETYAATSYGFNGFGYVDVLDGETVICSTSRFQLVVLRNAQDGADPSTAYSNGIIEATERANAAAEAAEGVILQAVPTMSQYIKGGAKLGDGLTVEDETLSLSGESYTTAEKTKLAGIEANANNYTLPTMGASTKGGAKLGSGLTVQNDVLSLSSHEHDTDDITSGVLPIAHGGTGASTAAGALSAILEGSPLGVSDGGTGAATAQAARESLNVVACQDQTNMGAYVGKLDSANQIWDLVSKCINSKNPTRDGHTIGLLVLNDGIGCYDWNGGGTFWKLGAVTTTTTTVSNIITAASGITINSATYTERNGVATLTISAKGFSTTGNITVGTVSSGKRPTMTIYGCVTSSICPYASLTSNGVLTTNWASAASSSSNYLMTFTYVLA